VPRSVIVDPSDEVRILHVDDDTNQSEFLKYFLPEMDETFRIDFVSDPCRVMEKMQSVRYDCVVTDYQMPKMNGIELAEKIRESFDLPIIIYTGQGSEEIAEAAFSAGIDDYLRKEMDPSHYQVLAKRVRHVVEKKRMETLYRTVVEQARDALSIFIGGRIVFANQATLDLLGVESLSEIIDSNPFTLRRNGKPDASILETGFHECEINTKNKETRYIEVSTSPIDYNGQKAVMCFSRDVTEKKRLELDNRISQTRFRTLVDLVPDGIISLSPLGYATFVNDTFLKLTGFSREEIVGKHLTSIGTIRKQDLFKHIQTFASIIKGNIPPPIEFHWKKKDGTPGLGEAYLSLIDVEGKKEILMFARDITSKKKREKEFENLFNNAPDGIIELSSGGEIRSINEAALRYANVSKVEALGKQFVEVFNMIGGESTEVYRLFSNRIKNRRRKIKPFELMLLNDRDVPTWVEAHPSIIEVDEEDYEVQLVFRDFTERKKAEEERKLYAEQLEQFILENSNIFDSEKIEQISIELESNITRIEDHLSRLKMFDDSNLAELDGIESSLDQVNNIITSLTKELASSQNIHQSSLQLVEKDVYNT